MRWWCRAMPSAPRCTTARARARSPPPRPWSPTWWTSPGCTPPTPTTACRTWPSSPTRWPATPILPMEEVVTAYYLRLRVADQAGVLSRITTILAEHDISIDAVLQRESAEGERQTDLIILTHDTREGRMNQAMATMQALPTVLAPIVRIRKEELELRYVSTRGDATPRAFCDILLEGLAPDGGLYLPQRYPRVDAATLDALARAAVRRPGVRDPVAVHRRHPRRRPARAVPQDLRARGVRQRRDRAAARAGAGPVDRGPVQRPDAGLQGHGDAAARRAVRVRARAPRRAAQHPGRHLGRHRQRGRVRDARQARRAGVHAVAARPHEPVPAGADVQPAGRQHPQHRDRGRVRRLPGHRQGGGRRPGLQAAAPHRQRQLDQLGAAGGPGGVLLRRLLPGHPQQRPAGQLRRAIGQLRQRLRRPRGAHRWACRSSA